MTRWMLDNGVIDLLAGEFDVLRPWPNAPEAIIVDVVAKEACRGGGRRPQRSFLVEGDIANGVVPWLQTVALPLDGEPLAALLRLRPKEASADKNLGEDASIALAATTERAAILVTLDKTAAFVALAELGPCRVCTPFDFWADLYVRGLIDDPCLHRLHGATCRQLGRLGGGRMGVFQMPGRF